MNNKVFYQHPNLMRALGMHETVMEVMVNVLGGGGDSKVSLFTLLEEFRQVLLYELFQCEPTSFILCLIGDSIPPNGDQLLPFPVLLLPH